MAIDWARGWSAAWHVREVDKGSWADAGELAGVTEVNVTRDRSGDAPLIDSGDLTRDADPSERFAERYLRVSVNVTQGTEHERRDVCTLLCSSSGGEVRRGVDRQRIEGRSVLYPASTAGFGRGTYIPKGWDVPTWAAAELRKVLSAPVVVSGGKFKLAEHYVVDLGADVLSSVWGALKAGGWGLAVAEDGTVRVRPEPKSPKLSLDRAGARLLHPGVTHELDWSGVPNRYIAVDGSTTATVTNAKAASPTSTKSRGYRHDEWDTSPKRLSGETLRAYAERRLEEMSTVEDARSYRREWVPDTLPGDVVRGSIPSVALEGDLRIVSQDLTCGRGIVVTEKAVREVKAWTR